MAEKLATAVEKAEIPLEMIGQLPRFEAQDALRTCPPKGHRELMPEAFLSKA
jgi:hypothetical protein